MDFTREPVIQTVITPREGFRLVVRSSKTQGLEEHFVDAVEIVCFGSATFFRSIERPKPFVVPATDYEVLEVREPRVMLKTPAVASQKQGDRQRLKPEVRADSQKAEMKSAEPRVESKSESDKPKVTPKEREKDKEKSGDKEIALEKGEEEVSEEKASQQVATETRPDRRRDRRRGFRRRRGRDEVSGDTEDSQDSSGDQVTTPAQERNGDFNAVDDDDVTLLTTAPMLSSILPPPTTLIRDDLERLRGTYKEAFYDTDFNESDDSNSHEAEFSQDSLEINTGTDSIEEFAAQTQESGDAEVPLQEPFRDEQLLPEDAANAQKNDQ